MHHQCQIKKKLIKSALNHTFWGTFWSVFPKFALQKGKIFGADANYLRVGFEITKSDARIQKSGKNPPPSGILCETPKLGCCRRH